MRCFGEWRRAAIALGVAVALGTGLADSTEAGIFFHTIPREAAAYDYATGGEFFAPPVPYGHYAKDPVGYAHGLMGGLTSHLHGLGHGHGHGHDGCGHGVGHGLGGAGCGLGCGLGSGGLGHGGLGHGLGGHGLGCGLGGCGLGGGLGAGGCGIAGHVHGAGVNGGDPCGTTVVAAPRRVKNFGPIHATTVVATAQTAPSAQAVVLPTAQHVHGGVGVIDPCSACHGRGCGLCGGGLLGKLKCNLCGGRGCGGCGGLGVGDPCSSCGGKGCGLCNGCGLLNKLKQCLLCHGAGCKFCKPHLGKLHGLLGGLMGPKFDYFVGAGGPVPLTPGYVPYIVTTRSPRDFFAFPPRTPDGF